MATDPTTTVPIPNVNRGPNPADSMPMGVHSSLRVASKHKKMVSAVLHLKKESMGRKTAYNTKGAKAFTQPKPKLKVGK